MLKSWLYAIFHPSYVKRLEDETRKRTHLLGYAGQKVRRLEGDVERAKVAYEERRRDTLRFSDEARGLRWKRFQDEHIIANLRRDNAKLRESGSL